MVIRSVEEQFFGGPEIRFEGARSIGGGRPTGQEMGSGRRPPRVRNGHPARRACNAPRALDRVWRPRVRGVPATESWQQVCPGARCVRCPHSVVREVSRWTDRSPPLAVRRATVRSATVRGSSAGDRSSPGPTRARSATGPGEARGPLRPRWAVAGPAARLSPSGPGPWAAGADPLGQLDRWLASLEARIIHSWPGSLAGAAATAEVDLAEARLAHRVDGGHAGAVG